MIGKRKVERIEFATSFILLKACVCIFYSNCDNDSNVEKKGLINIQFYYGLEFGLTT